MTPGARIAAAIEVLDRIGGGEPAEKALTGWARAHRFAGSRDRAAIRDHVFDVLRCRRSAAWLGGGEDGRALMIGLLRLRGERAEAYFTGDGYAPAPLAAGEGQGPPLSSAPGPVRLDWPDWLMPETRRSLGDALEAVCEAGRARAPVFLRVNLPKATPETAIAALAADGIAAHRHSRVPAALVLEGPARGLPQTTAFREGLVELQDAASQAVVDALPVDPGARVLDLCAGGGGKSLALAARGAQVTAHDADPARMRDLPARAARAGAEIAITDAPESGAPWPLVLADVPCSGSGAWRRAPEGKWRLTPERLRDLASVQDGLLDRAARLAGERGRIAYVTCSVLECENADRVAAFRRRCPGWRLTMERRFLPGPEGDGFYLALLTRDRAPQ